MSHVPTSVSEEEVWEDGAVTLRTTEGFQNLVTDVFFKVVVILDVEST